MTLSKSQVQQWNPATLTEIGDAWTSMAQKIEGMFDRYKSAVTTINGSHWEGVAAEAAQRRADSDHKAAVRVADHLERAAKIAQNGFHEIDPPLQRARNAIAAAEADGFTVSEDLRVSKSGELADGDAKAMADHQREITDAASATERADRNVTTALTAVRGDLRVAFVSAGALGSEQAQADSRQLLDDPSKLTPEQQQRLAEAGSLSPADADALLAGDRATIPASQMEYMNAVVRSLDGKSPQEIEAILNQLPPDARRGLANSLELVSNERVTASVRGDTEIPTDGSLNLLPTQMRQSLTRGDLVTVKEEMNAGRNPGGGPVKSATLNGVAENQAIARIVDAADPNLKQGSSLDKSLLEVGRTYLDAQVRQDQAGQGVNGYDHSPLIVDGQALAAPGTPITEPIFAAVADDKLAIEGAFSNTEHGQDFVRDLLTNQWSDDGQAAKGLIHFADGDQVITPGEGHTGQVVAERSGNIMEAVARTMSSDDTRNLLMNIPGTDLNTVSAGELNPELMREVSRSLAPYLPEMAAGSSAPDMRTAGFDTGTAQAGDPANWINPDSRFGGLTNIFTALGTDTAPGGAGDIFRAAADHTILGQQGMYAADPYAPNSTGHLAVAGTLQATMDKGLLSVLQDGNNDTVVSAQDVYDAKARAYDMVSKLGDYGLGKLPGSEYVNLMQDIGGGGDGMKEIFIGSAPPEHATVADVPAPNFDARTAQIVQAVPPDLIPPHFRAQEDYDWMFNGDKIVDYRTALINAHNTGVPASEVGAGFREVLASLGDRGQETVFREYYNTVVVQPVAGAQPR